MLRLDTCPPPAHLTALERLVDAFGCAIFVTDADGGLLWTNEAAARHLGERTVLVELRGTLRSTDTVTQCRLRRAIREVAALAARRPAVVSLRGDYQGRPFLLLVIGWRSEGAGGPQGGAVVVAGDPEAAAGVPAPVLREAYAFTPAQSRVAALLTQGRGLAEIAAILGVTRGTVRCHLRDLFAATGASRQAELVQQLLSGPVALLATFPVAAPARPP